jgi:phosphoribosyl 1,2-cyclic phosphodiesterase
MNIKTLGSSSHGNCHLLDDGKTKILLDAGFKYSAIRKLVKHNLSSLGGALITHEHKDHSLAVKRLLDAGVEAYGSMGAFKNKKHHRINHIKENEFFEIGTFKIKTFKLIHDCEEPLGFYIYSNATNETLAYITDTQFISVEFKKIDYLMIEANYCEDLLIENLKSGKIETRLFERVLKTHLSFQKVQDFLKKHNDLKELHLMHLSDVNTNSIDFYKKLKAIVGEKTIVKICKKYEDVYYE